MPILQDSWNRKSFSLLYFSPSIVSWKISKRSLFFRFIGSFPTFCCQSLLSLSRIRPSFINLFKFLKSSSCCKFGRQNYVYLNQNRSAGDQTSSFGPIVNNFVSDNSNATTNLDNQLGLGAVATSTTQTDTTQALDAFQTFSFANPLNNSTYTGFPQISHVNHTSVSASSRKVHPGLHMAAFEIGLHALCVLNCVSSNWLSRTYSTYESWIQS